MNEVHSLYEGNIIYESGFVIEAHSSVTLIRTAAADIVVDVSDGPAREAIRAALADFGTSPEGIDTVVLTHTHGDHIGNLDMFPNARVMAHREERPWGGIELVEDGQTIVEGVRIMHTPGHTRGSISVVVDSERTFVIAGDALPTVNNFVKWVPPGINYDPRVALDSMSRIVDVADVIIPGHGPAFDSHLTKGGPI